MRWFLINPLVVLTTCVGGWAICAILAWSPHLREMALAAITCLVAAEMGLVPILISGAANQAAVAQASLIGTVLHLFAGIALAASLMFGLHLDRAFIYWLMPFYWVTLTVLVITFIRAVRSAPISSAHKQ
jgi:hypothetical protein